MTLMKHLRRLTLDSFWEEVLDILTDEDDEDGYGVYIGDAKAVIESLKDPGELADFIYTYHRKFNP
jgi:hypothetical protein